MHDAMPENIFMTGRAHIFKKNGFLPPGTMIIRHLKMTVGAALTLGMHCRLVLKAAMAGLRHTSRLGTAIVDQGQER